MIIFNTKIYWKFEEEKKIINPLSDKSVYNFKGNYNHKMPGILICFYEWTSLWYQRQWTWINLDQKFPLSTNMSRPRTARLDLINGKLLVKKNNLFY